MPDIIILAGNPNVGKSTIFNSLTGLRQHTGNWTGKTVGSTCGFMALHDNNIMIIDTPGTYSLIANSPDELAAAETICNEECNHIVYVCDASCLEKSLYLLLQIMEKRGGITVCLNLMDEAERKGISIDAQALSRELSLPVIPMSASSGKGLNELIAAISNEGFSEIKDPSSTPDIISIKKKASEIAEKVIIASKNNSIINLLDKLICSKIFGVPIMLLMLFALLWISISAANVPSQLLSRLFSLAGTLLRNCAFTLGVPETLTGIIIDGIYGTTAWVVSVMLPPMAIFFPLFTLLEDFGLLPRIAFNLDPIFKYCGSCGKQSLTMCMGLGCNAVGVTSCAIISSPGQKLISILTNSFMPCNGRFPTIILLAAILYPDGGDTLAPAAVMTVILLGALITLISTKLLSIIYCRNEKLSFTLELPPYRKPKIWDTLVRSFYDRTAKVLFRAIKASAPAGLIIWFLANLKFNDTNLISYICLFLDKPASIFGLNGTILFAFILGLPANEIVMPIILMCYTSGSSLMLLPAAEEVGRMLRNAGWNECTIICVIIFTLFHWPCSTTLMTIKKEYGKMRYVFLSALIPCLWGFLLCYIVNLIL
ncbi:MAG: ferrous iron transporter B [Ruminococcaceae bacterium]|nr:ferrous iron transporter B [Oscillospiraceae bacterium]